MFNDDAATAGGALLGSNEASSAQSSPSPFLDHQQYGVAHHLTDFPAPPPATAETVETIEPDLDVITNDEFLRSIFKELPPGLHPGITNFSGSPLQARNSVWGGQPWSPGADTSNEQQNWYFTLGVYGHDEALGWRRQKQHCRAIYGVMLDDIDTKAVPLERLEACPPTWLIETSPGNYQAGYLFDVPLTDVTQVDALQKALIQAGMCDPGADGPAARWSRLPHACNGKHSPAYPCRLVKFNPKLRYSIKELMEKLELEPPRQGRKARQPAQSKKKTRPVVLSNEVHRPRPAENPVVAALRIQGLYKAALGDRKHDITCPWVHEHTDKVDHGTAYFEPNEGYPIGGFKCQHGHCTERRIGDLLLKLGLQTVDARNRATIYVAGGELDRVVDAAERELAANGRYYQNGGMIVTVDLDPISNEAAIRPLNEPTLLRALSAVASWERYDARKEDFAVTDPPSRHVSVLFHAESYPHLAHLRGIAHQPYLREDGTLMQRSGYDPHTGMYGTFDDKAFSVPESPSKEQAKAALAELRELLSETRFADPAQARAATLAGMLTAAIRPSLPTAPLFHVRAPQWGSGKSYLTRVIALFAAPGRPQPSPLYKDEAEVEKFMLSVLAGGPPVVMFDNLTSDIHPTKALCMVLTEPRFKGRILQVSKVATVSTRTMFLSSGNNVGPVADMVRRTVVIPLNPQAENATEIVYGKDPEAMVRNNRARYVSLALTIIRAWIAAGEPLTKCSQFNDYAEWNRFVRQPLLWLGEADPVGAILDTMRDDPDSELLGRFLRAWKACFGSARTMVRKAVAQVENTFSLTPALADLREVILEIAEERGLINRKRLGKWLARYEGRIVGGLRLARGDEQTSSAVAWKVEAATVSTVSTVTSQKSSKIVPDKASDNEKVI